MTETVTAETEAGASMGKFECHQHADGSMVHSSQRPGKYMAVTPDLYILRGHQGDILHFHSAQAAWDGLSDHGFGPLVVRQKRSGLERLHRLLSQSDEELEAELSQHWAKQDATTEPAHAENAARKQQAP